MREPGRLHPSVEHFEAELRDPAGPYRRSGLVVLLGDYPAEGYTPTRLRLGWPAGAGVVLAYRLASGECRVCSVDVGFEGGNHVEDVAPLLAGGAVLKLRANAGLPCVWLARYLGYSLDVPGQANGHWLVPPAVTVASGGAYIGGGLVVQPGTDRGLYCAPQAALLADRLSDEWVVASLGPQRGRTLALRPLEGLAAGEPWWWAALGTSQARRVVLDRPLSRAEVEAEYGQAVAARAVEVPDRGGFAAVKLREARPFPLDNLRFPA